MAVSELLLGASAGLVMVRIIPIDRSLIYQYNGMCRKISPLFCDVAQAITTHGVSFTYSLLPLSFWYRHYVISNPRPSSTRVSFLCFLVYIPAFICLLIQIHALTADNPEELLKILLKGYPAAVYPTDQSLYIVSGYLTVKSLEIAFLILWICFSVFPGYIISIYYRRKIIRILNTNTRLSQATVSAQRKLVKALTIQAMLPFAMLTSSPLFLWEQFQLPFVEYVPYYEEWGFLSLALTSVISPLVTIYYVLPYRRWIMKLFCKTKRLGPTTANYAPTNASTLKATEGSNLMDQLI